MFRLMVKPVILFVVLALCTPCMAGSRKTHVIKKGDTPGAVAKRFGVSVDELYRFNNLRPGGPFKVGTKLEVPEKGEVTGGTYLVKPGDSVAKVADFHGVSQDDLRRENKMGKGAKLQAGQQIVIPMNLRGGTSGHVVRKGDTVASIAQQYGVTAKDVMIANKMNRNSRLQIGRTVIIPDPQDTAPAYKPAKTNKLVKTGEKIPGGVRHTVQTGQTLWTIARAYNVKGAKIAARNEISTDTPLTVGQVIIVPGAQEVVPVRVKGYVIEPVRFVRVWNNESVTLKLMTKGGKVNQASRKKLSNLAGPRGKKSRAALFHPRLIHMIQRVVERWPGHSIEIVSGYRPGQSGNESKHSQARAVDFRVKGIQNKELYDFCTQLPNSGCGYYPNSVFVHMDARDKPTTWTDFSAPGEDPKYH